MTALSPIDSIIADAAVATELSVADVKGWTPGGDHLRARHAVTFVARNAFDYSYLRIGRKLGGRCQGSIFNAFKSARAKIAVDADFAWLCDRLLAGVHQRQSQPTPAERPNTEGDAA